MKHMLTEIVAGSLIGLAGFGVLAGCASLTAVECNVTAVHKVLGPNPDPEQVTLFDVRDIAGRMKACKAQDAGQ